MTSKKPVFKSSRDIAKNVEAVMGPMLDPNPQDRGEIPQGVINASQSMYSALKNIENDGGQIPYPAWLMINEAIAEAEGRKLDDFERGVMLKNNSRPVVIFGRSDLEMSENELRCALRQSVEALRHYKAAPRHDPQP